MSGEPPARAIPVLDPTGRDEGDAALAALGRIEEPLALLYGLFAHSPVPYIIYRGDGHPVVANPAFREMFGAVPPPEYSVLEDEVARSLGLDDVIRRAFAGETVRLPTVWYDPKELRHVQAPGHTRRVAIACTFFPLTGPGGAVGHVAVAYKDVTAELEARDRAEAERDQFARAIEERDRLTRALGESEARLRETLDAAEVGTWQWKVAEDRVEWSDNIERIFGMAPGTFGGTYDAWIDLIHPDDRATITAAVTAAVERGESYSADLRYLRPDGSIGWHGTRAHAKLDEHGRTTALRGIVVDVTARRSAEERLKEQAAVLDVARRHAESLAEELRASELRYKSFVSQSTEGIWRCELREPIAIDLPPDRQIEAIYRSAYLAECNDAMARMYGHERAGDLIGAPMDSLLVRDDPRNREYLTAFIESGYRLEGAESHELDKDGARRVFHNSLVGVVEGGKVIRAWGTQRDVTAQFDARELAERANRAKDEFLAMLGHELRNPLSPILTALELMKMRGDDVFSRERAIIERQVRHVVRLVDDLLDVSRITRGKVAIEARSVDLAACLASAIELASPLIEQRAQKLAVELPRLMVHGDAVRLAQVFTNLLTNAAKFSPRGGAIAIAAEQAGDRVKIAVSDRGMGIRREMLPRVFDLFSQEHQALDRSEGGLGLGLAIVRSLVELHGGAVEAASDGPGQGSVFTVWLPVGRAAAVGSLAPPIALPAGERRRVLVVDDNEDAAALLAAGLRSLGHDVRVAHDGPTALDLARRFVPEVGLLDIGLPVMDGYELARRLRSSPGLERIPLIAVTGYGQAEDRRNALEAGFDELLVKPVDLAAVAARVASPPR